MTQNFLDNYRELQTPFREENSKSCQENYLS